MIAEKIILEPVEDSIFKQFSPEHQDILRRSGAVPVLEHLMPLWNLPKGTHTCVLISGRGGAKTHGVSDFIAGQSAVYKKRCVVLRDEKSHIKDTILNEILLRYDTYDEYLNLSAECEKQATGIKEKKTGKELVYTKGFRASDSKKRANMKGVSDIDISVIEEAEDLIDQDKYNVFADSIRKDGALIILILNTPDIGHWVIERYFDTIAAPVPPGIPDEFKKDFEGYFEIIPKKNLKGVQVIQTGYWDNPYLPENIVSQYKAYGDPFSPTYNPHYYMTAIMGYSSSGRKGQILKKVKPITLKEYLALPFREFYGQDFGTASPAGLVGVKFDKNNCYCRELNYLPMNTLDIAKTYIKLGFGPMDKIIADCADDKAWKRLRRGFKAGDIDTAELAKHPKLVNGFNVFPCTKGTDSVTDGLDLMDGMNLFAVSESKNLWQEIRFYVWAQDKNGNYINEPIDEYNHLIDPWRYVVNDQRGKKKWSVTSGWGLGYCH